MATERKPVTIHYRKFSRPIGISNTLEELIRSAMDTIDGNGHRIRDRYLSRTRKVGTDNFFINLFDDGSGGTPLVFGDVLHFTKGHLQALCRTANQNASMVPVQQMRAPAQSEYVHSQMFWMVKGDHAFVLQSQSLKTGEFEEYLDWLLKTCTSKLNANHSIILEARFDAQAIGGDLEDIKEIIIGGIATSPALTVPDRSNLASEEFVEEERVVTQHGHIGTGGSTGFAGAHQILSVLLGGDAKVASLLSAVPEDAELNVQVHIGYATKRRNINRTALKQLETGLRNLPDSQLQVKSKGANLASDGTIRLHHPVSIRLLRAQEGDSQIVGSLLDPTDVLRAMFEAYSTFVGNGKIQ
jgi:hypothetical protein